MCIYILKTKSNIYIYIFIYLLYTLFSYMHVCLLSHGSFIACC